MSEGIVEVGDLEADIGEVIERGVSRGGLDGFGAGVDREDIAGLGPFPDGDGEASDIAADVEDTTAVGNEGGDATSIFALIEIEAGLLSIH